LDFVAKPVNPSSFKQKIEHWAKKIRKEAQERPAAAAAAPSGLAITGGGVPITPRLSSLLLPRRLGEAR
jgi:hypothetical protein